MGKSKIQVKQSQTVEDGYLMHLYTFYINGSELGYIAFNNNYIEAIYVNPKYRHKGFGKLMLQFGIKHGLNNLEVAQNNTPAINLYKQAGFTIDNETENKGIKTYMMSLKESNKKPQKIILYHLSPKKQDTLKLTPKVPSNFLIDNGYEDKETKRICFSKSINGALRALSKNLEGQTLYVYTVEVTPSMIYQPSVKEVPDVKLTQEVWLLEPIEAEYLQTIKVGSAIEPGLPYTYGNNTAELYSWNYKLTEALIEPIKEIKKVMNTIKYQAYDKDGIKLTDEEMGHAVIQSIKHTLDTKSGTCVEQALLEKSLFDKAKIPADVYFIEYCEDSDTNIYPSHCFVIYNYNKKYCWFEHAWNKYKGIHEYDSLEAAFEDISSKFCKKEYQDSLTITKANDLKAGMNEDDICENQVGKKLENKKGTYKLEPSINLETYRNIVKQIKQEADKYEKSGPYGNQNCLLCTWAVEMQIRGNSDFLPRPVYSPEDPIFTELNSDGYKLFENSSKTGIKDKKDLLNKILESANNTRFYCHVNWKDSHGGHEFILIHLNDKIYIIDGQAGKVINIETKPADAYFKDINFNTSFIVRIDDKEINEDILKYNNMKYLYKDQEVQKWQKEHNILTEDNNNKLTPEQELFFKSSKIRNKQGELLKVWHGTTAHFNTFNSVTNWFSVSKKYAQEFALSSGTCSSYYLNCSHTLYCGDTSASIYSLFPLVPPLKLSVEALQLAKKLNISIEEFKEIAKQVGEDVDPDHHGYKAKLFSIIRRPDIAKKIKALGYDSVCTIELSRSGEKVICFGVYDPTNIKSTSNISPTNNSNVNETLKEDTRTMLLTKSKSVGGYKDTSRGKNRFERKKFSKISHSVREYNKINMNNLFKSDLLQVDIPVTGETNNYTVSVKMDGVIAEIQKNIKNNHNKFEFRTVIQALTKVFNTTNIYVKCTCDDYKYNYAHWNIINNVSTDDTAHDPGPGKGIKNPNDEKGRGCKHVLLVLANGDWLMKVASVINNYVHYAEEHLQKPFLNIIFPKLYGIEAEDAVEEGLIDDDKYLDSTPGFIDAINEYGRNRGKIQKGSNKNPVAEKEKNKVKAEEEDNKNGD